MNLIQRLKTWMLRGRVFVHCPHHEERTPSCLLDPKTGQAICFGCGWEGVIDHRG